MFRAATIIDNVDSPTLHDHRLVYEHCQHVIDTLAVGGILDDATAKVIASWHVSSSDAAAFVTTGEIRVHPIDLFTQFLPLDEELGVTDHTLLGLLGRYLLAHGPRTAVEGWEQLWVR